MEVLHSVRMSNRHSDLERTCNTLTFVRGNAYWVISEHCVTSGNRGGKADKMSVSHCRVYLLSATVSYNSAMRLCDVKKSLAGEIPAGCLEKVTP